MPRRRGRRESVEGLLMSDASGEPPPVDARYTEAVRKQREARERKQLAQRRAPILRVVWDLDEAEGETTL
jgi:hypothetical protein